MGQSTWGVVRMVRRGAVLGLALLCLVQGELRGPVDKCAGQCQQVYSLNQANFEQVRPSLDACQAGCQFFGRIDARNGVHDTLGNLQSCNQSCDERFEGALLPACQSGCGFHFDSNVSAQRNVQQLSRQGPSPPAPIFTRGPPPPPPTFPRARGPTFVRTQGPPRPTVFRPEASSSQAWQESPRTTLAVPPSSGSAFPSFSPGCRTSSPGWIRLHQGCRRCPPWKRSSPRWRSQRSTKMLRSLTKATQDSKDVQASSSTCQAWTESLRKSERCFPKWSSAWSR